MWNIDVKWFISTRLQWILKGLRQWWFWVGTIHLQSGRRRDTCQLSKMTTDNVSWRYVMHTYPLWWCQWCHWHWSWARPCLGHRRRTGLCTGAPEVWAWAQAWVVRPLVEVWWLTVGGLWCKHIKQDQCVSVPNARPRNNCTIVTTKWFASFTVLTVSTRIRNGERQPLIRSTHPHTPKIQ